METVDIGHDLVFEIQRADGVINVDPVTTGELVKLVKKLLTEVGGRMETVALSVKDAEAFLAKHERHYKAPVEAICAIGVGDYNDATVGINEPEVLQLHGAAILGRNADGDGELAHIYVDGISQGYSLLYGACWRALKALGYKRAIL